MHCFIHCVAFRHKEGFAFDTEWDPADPKRHVYSRYTTPISIRVEKVLSSILVCIRFELFCATLLRVPRMVPIRKDMHSHIRRACKRQVQ